MISRLDNASKFSELSDSYNKKMHSDLFCVLCNQSTVQNSDLDKYNLLHESTTFKRVKYNV